MCWTHRETVACDASGATRGRHVVTTALTRTFEAAGHGADPRAEELVHDAALAISELLSNAVRASRTEVEVTVDVHHNRIRLAVYDDGPDRPELHRAGDRDVGGRGLMIVDALSSSWGVDRQASGKRVWCELPMPTALTRLECTDRIAG